MAARAQQCWVSPSGLEIITCAVEGLIAEHTNRRVKYKVVRGVTQGQLSKEKDAANSFMHCKNWLSQKGTTEQMLSRC